MPGLVLSSAFCCLDLLLWSWYKYHTFSWTAYSWSTELKTEIKRGGVPSRHHRVEKVLFHAPLLIWLLYTCPFSVNDTWGLHVRSTWGGACFPSLDLWKAMRRISSERRFQKRLQPELQSHFPLAVWGPQLKSQYIQSKCWKVVYDSFLFRLSVWNLCGLKVSRNPVAGYAVWDLLSPDKHLHVWRLRDFRLSREV